MVLTFPIQEYGNLGSFQTLGYLNKVEGFGHVDLSYNFWICSCAEVNLRIWILILLEKKMKVPLWA